jgi:hypothetical protein
MAITKPQGPSGGAAVVGRAVAHLMARGPGALPPLAGAAAPQTSQPIRLFMLNLKDISDESFLKKAVPIGWRYVIVGPGPIAVADVKDAGGGAPGFASLIRGTIAQRLEQASELAQQYESRPGLFEPRILEIPSLYISAFWLHGPHEIFIPFLEGGEKDTMPVKEDPSFVTRVAQAASKHASVGVASP